MLNNRAEVKESQDEVVNNQIKRIFKKALLTETNRGKLENFLLHELELKSDFKWFEKLVEMFVNDPLSSYGYFWKPNFMGHGSRLRAALINAEIAATKVRNDYVAYQAQEKIVSQLNQQELSWEELDKLRDTINDHWHEPIKGDLLYLSYYKQAEILFEAGVLGHQSGYSSAIISMKKILYLLCYGYDDKINTYYENKGAVDVFTDICADKEISLTELLDNFCNELPVQFFKHAEVAVLFLELCREWLLIGAHISTCVSPRYSHENEVSILQLNDAETFLSQTQDITLHGSFLSQTFNRPHQSFNNMVVEFYRSGGNNIVTYFLEELKRRFQAADERCGQDFVALKLFRQLSWVANLPSHRELIVFNQAAIKEFVRSEKNSSKINYVMPQLSHYLAEELSQREHLRPIF